MRPKLSVISESNSKNLGDQAIARSLTGILRFDYEVSLVSFGDFRTREVKCEMRSIKSPLLFSKLMSIFPAKIKARIKWYIMGEKSHFSEYFRHSTKDSDFLIVGGGQLIKNNIALFCEKLALIGHVSRYQSKPLALVGVGVDKEMNGLTWRIANKTLRNSCLIIARDLVSKFRVQEYSGAREKCVALPDLAFGLVNPEFNCYSETREKSLAINVMSFKSMAKQFGDRSESEIREFVSGLSRIIRRANGDGYKVLLFTSGSPDDFCSAKHLHSEVVLKVGIDLPIFHPSNLDGLLHFLSGCDDIIAMRMHAGVLSYISGCNPLCLNWDDKVKGVWEMVGQEERVITFDDISGNEHGIRIFEKFRCLERPSHRSISSLADEVRETVIKQVNMSFNRYNSQDISEER